MNHDARRRLEALLDSEIEAARRLSTHLAGERCALTGDCPEAVRQQAAEKVRLLETLEGLERGRRELDPAPDPMQFPGAGSEAAHGGGPVAHRWQELMQLIAQCRAANEVNGYIIHVRQNQIRQLMTIVRGAPPVTYGPQGNTLAKAWRTLAQA